MRRGEPGHGSRARYVAGCHCDLCRAANRAYLNDYKVARKVEGRQTVPSYGVVAHLAALRASGVELTAIARMSGCSPHHLRAVGRGEVPRVTRRLHDGVMSIQPGDYSENARVPVAEALKLVAEIRAAGIQTKTIARALGYRYHHLSFANRSTYVTQRTYRRLLIIAAAAGARRYFDVLEVVA
jgi:lambda repressor-like predicted transcriptional regulator